MPTCLWTSLGANNSGQQFGGGVFSPETAEQFEGGVKTEFFGGRLYSTLAYFYLTKTNILAPDTANPGYSIAVGKARSQGIEWDINGRVTDEFRLIGSYTYTDAVITHDTPETEGNRLYNVPENAASLWGTYDVTPNITFGTGVYLASQVQGDLANAYQLPGYVRWDMMAAYHQPIGQSRLTVQLNVNNVLDKRYYASTNGYTQITPGTPLFFMGAVKLEY
ncbi:MAG: TonB-dependent siderophore receptor [Candidatus Methylumidiphilus sp.]